MCSDGYHRTATLCVFTSADSLQADAKRNRGYVKGEADVTCLARSRLAGISLGWPDGAKQAPRHRDIITPVGTGSLAAKLEGRPGLLSSSGVVPDASYISPNGSCTADVSGAQ